jgi:hypothetical protein
VVQDSGASLAFLISDAGFPSGGRGALKVKFNPVTWQQFQTELWRPMLMADALYEFVDAGTKPVSHPTLMMTRLGLAAS